MTKGDNHRARRLGGVEYGEDVGEVGVLAVLDRIDGTT
jgi:hypothetical protein